MSAKTKRKRRLLREFAIGLALSACSFGRTASAQQPAMPPQPQGVAAPGAVVVPPLRITGPLCGIADCSIDSADVDRRTMPTNCDPVSRVPNFFGDFVARPSRALVDQPAVSTTMTNTLTFVGRGVDVAGGIGPNTFYAPLLFAGPGGPYLITTNVTGTGVPPPPQTISILDENAQLTAKIDAKFPGATFASGTGLLQPPFAVSYEYFQTMTQTVPGLVAVVNLANPSGGGLVGRNKYFDDGSPLPQDRVFFDYSHVGDFKVLNTSIDINRYVFGVEKTFLNGFGSIEVLVPFAGTANSDQNGGPGMAVDNTEFGNVGLLLKGTLFRNANWAVTAGVGVSMPTADDSRILFAGQPVLEIRNRAWLLQPILGAVWAPNDRFYAQLGLQFDFDANGNPVYVRSPGDEFSQSGVLTDQTYLYASGAIGYWLYQCDTGFMRGVSLQGELHYDRTLGTRDVVQTGSVLVADMNSSIDVLNATTGVNFVLGDRSTSALGVSFPLAGDRLYDWNLMAQLNFRFGAGRALNGSRVRLRRPADSTAPSPRRIQPPTAWASVEPPGGPPADQANLAKPAPQPDERIRGRSEVDPPDDLVSPFDRPLADDDHFLANGGEPLGQSLGTGDRLASHSGKLASQLGRPDRFRGFDPLARSPFSDSPPRDRPCRPRLRTRNGRFEIVVELIRDVRGSPKTRGPRSERIRDPFRPVEG